ncbi:LOW QUALITY PROTEIN: hypothetical protein SPRG_05633 [Saprolegnia parasitica CBS 223.65]|uniref:Uncharacterized protein n=1 Tax=Saprolegnia parasitica (strain CBS 223.65) TaxID=695850 RepID=A0A067CT50_SAPPC|nr:LOW QUALITY PROTEIN: hypothetical protein SPRG_05633 [Saprolegnia parasitica CBS 223.65]KDO29681.1 LOW QUALITY PROTEIN: hypothetical protein SPRG_05633 [Saprolegnia parasitica CBS 223.65]|eukprot:XP_012199739.1 LOW QUALITY PROTEIN: hypothetical protein SPRG_05633 [Saprolegnia parasitica CBS 223.65]
MVKSMTQEPKSYAQMVLEMFMAAPQVSVRGARVPSDMSRCNSARAHKAANWANAHQFPLANPCAAPTIYLISRLRNVSCFTIRTRLLVLSHYTNENHRCLL